MKNIIFTAILAFSLNMFLISQVCTPVTGISEGFNTENLPQCWTTTTVYNPGGTAPSITLVTSSSPAPVAKPFEGKSMIFFNSNSCVEGSKIRLESPIINTKEKTGINVSFAWFESAYGRTDSVILQYSTNNKLTWTRVAVYYRANFTDPGWKVKSINLPEGAENQDTLHIGFLFVSNNAWNCLMDDIKVVAGLPSFSETTVSGISIDTAVIQTSVLSSIPVTAKGICYSASTNPTLSGEHTSDGTGTGSFSSTLRNLNPGYKYYARAYATNSLGTSYGKEISFTTLCKDSLTAISEGFNSSNLSSCWKANTVFHSGGYVPTISTNATNNYPQATPFEGSHMLKFNSMTCGSGSKIRLESPSFYFKGKRGINVSFRWFHSTSTSSDSMTVQYSFDKITWKRVGVVERYGPENGWKYKSYTLPEDAEDMDTVYFGFLFTAQGGYDCLIDDINIITDVPSIATTPLSSLSETTATLGGEITGVADYEVTKRGICWGTSPGVTLEDDSISKGKGIGSFTTELTGLIDNTTYYARAYATIATGTFYGNEVNFKTPCFPATSVFERFNDLNLPGCWNSTIVKNTGSNEPAISIVTSNSNPTAIPYEGSRMIRFNSFDCSDSSQIRLECPPVTTVGKTDINLSFKWFESNFIGKDSVTVVYSFDKITWKNVVSFPRYSTVSGWEQKSIMLPKDAENQNKVYVGFLFTSSYGYDCLMDDIKLRSLIPTVTVSLEEKYWNWVVFKSYIEYDGDSVITSKGLCWGTSPGVDISSQHLSSGLGQSDFYTTLTELNLTDNYYLRTYVTIASVTYYSNELVYNYTFAGISDKRQDKQLNIFPSPTTGKITVASGDAGVSSMEIEVFNVIGQSILKRNIHNGDTIDLKGNKKGIYLVKINDGSGVKIKRIILE